MVTILLKCSSICQSFKYPHFFNWLDIIYTFPCFSYLIEYDVCYLVLCEKNYSKRLAYSYLEDIAREFHSQYGKRVNTVTRPYTFIEFDTYIQKAKKIFTDSRARRNLSAINNQLQDVQRIMVQNIDDVLQRGTVLSGKKNCIIFYVSVFKQISLLLRKSVCNVISF